MEGCTFQPAINRKTKGMVKGRPDNACERLSAVGKKQQRDKLEKSRTGSSRNEPEEVLYFLLNLSRFLSACGDAHLGSSPLCVLTSVIFSNPSLSHGMARFMPMNRW